MAEGREEFCRGENGNLCNSDKADFLENAPGDRVPM